jgi:nicotinate-nucleotide pyrophosphorylase (carboxylating)
MKIDSNTKYLINLAKYEDLGKGDVTSELVVPGVARGRANLAAREKLVVCGMEVAAAVLKEYDPKLKLAVYLPDGTHAKAGDVLGEISGPLRAMLSAERVVLNFLQRLSGIATLTARYVELVKGTKAQIYDTRKTTPGWRTLEKYAVMCGGGYNHRTGLYDAVLIKDNHVTQFDDRIRPNLEKLVEKARMYKGLKFFEVEVDSLEQLREVLLVKGVDIVLLDNMKPAMLKKAVAMRNKLAPKVELEASGGVNLKTVRAIARTGVERISVGAITHSATAVDIGLDI